MKKHITYSLILFLGAVFFACQKENLAEMDQEKTFVKYYGYQGDQEGKCLIATTDGNYLIFGTTASFTSTDLDFYLIKVNPEGNELWSKIYAMPNMQQSIKVVETASGFLLLGQTVIPNVSAKMELCKVDRQGNQIKTLTVRQDSTGFDYAVDLATTTTGGFVLTGTTSLLDSKTHSNPETDGSDVYVSLLNSDLEEVWEPNTFGENGINHSIAVQAADQITVISSSEIILNGVRNCAFKKTYFDYDKRTVINSKTYPIGQEAILNPLLCKRQMGGHTIIWQTQEAGSYQLVEISPDFTPLEQPVFLWDDLTISPSHLIQCSDGGYLLSASFDGDGNDFLLRKYSKEGGQSLWQSTFGYTGNDIAGQVLELPNGGYLLTGGINLTTNRMAALIRTNVLGELLVE